MKTVLIAGGSGYLGDKMRLKFSENGYKVLVLTRHPKHIYDVYWDPIKKEIDQDKIADCSILINLCGEGIDKKRWTEKRKRELFDSRVRITETLFELTSSVSNLQHYVSASGITAYGYEDIGRPYVETDPFGRDFLSDLVKEWENAADLFASRCAVTKMRIAVTMDPTTGALKKMSMPIKLGVGSPLGDGKQIIPWVATEDLIDQFYYVVEQNLEGVFNTNTGNISNEELTKLIASYYKKPLWMFNVPAFGLKLLLGEMAELVVNGVPVDNGKMRNLGFLPEKTSILAVLDK